MTALTLEFSEKMDFEAVLLNSENDTQEVRLRALAERILVALEGPEDSETDQ
jgi:hypothetical protein